MAMLALLSPTDHRRHPSLTALVEYLRKHLERRGATLNPHGTDLYENGFRAGLLMALQCMDTWK